MPLLSVFNIIVSGYECVTFYNQILYLEGIFFFSDGKFLSDLFPVNLRNYDVALRRFRVHESDGWKGIAPPMIVDFNPEPPIFSSKFANFGTNKHILAISNEDGMVKGI